MALDGGLLMRIDIQTQELTPFAQKSKVGRSWYMSVSNDGNSVIVNEPSTTLPTLFDLTGCSTRYDIESLPKTGALVEGCESINLMPYITEVHPEAYNGTFLGLFFGHENAQFGMRVAWRDSDSNWFGYRMTFTPRDYTPTASGYIAMGDSYSSGQGELEGGVWYEPGTDEQGDESTFLGRNLCHLSRRSYPYLLAMETGYLAQNNSTPPADGLFHSGRMFWCKNS